MSHDTVALPRNHFAVETTMDPVYALELHVTVNNNGSCVCSWVTCYCQLYQNTECCTTMLLGYIYVTDNNASYTYHFLKEIIFQLVCTLPHIAGTACIETKEYLFGHGLLQTYILAPQILSKSLRIYSVFVSTAVKHFTRSDGINHWWSNNIKYSECVSIALGTQRANRMLRIIM